MSIVKLVQPEEQGPSLEERFAVLDQQWEQFLGPTLAWQERRLFHRLHLYAAEHRRLEHTPAAHWRPRVRFVTVRGYIAAKEGPCDVFPHSDDNVDHLICVIDRKQWAIATARAKVKIVERRLAEFTDIVQARRRDIARIADQNRRLKILLAPRRQQRRRQYA